MSESQKRPVKAGWLDALSVDETIHCMEDLSLHFAEMSGPLKDTLKEWVLAKDFNSLANYQIDYSKWDGDIHHLIAARQVLGFYQKLECLPLGVDKTAAAFAKFRESEDLCRETNGLFRGLARGTVDLVPTVLVDRVLRSARAKISRILGPVPLIGDLRLEFGPGATASITKREASWQAKLAEMPSCSELLVNSGFLPSLLREMPHWLDCHSEDYAIDEEGWLTQRVNVKVDCAVLEFVPKTAKIERGIDKQPTLNTLLQKGIGDYMERRLKQFGIDTKDQKPNQVLAREGSLTGELATVDLSSASDCIATELVRFLLPEEWYALLRAASCNVTSYKGKLIRLEKFCSMGNAFTFPLETLLFWALVRSACEGGVVRVYGDDIICPSKDFESVRSVLVACGFLLNSGKSFAAGPFRESCGADYYKGIDIRPYFQKTAVTGETLFTCHNFMYRNFGPEECELVALWIHPDLKIYGPINYGDGHLHGKWNGRRNREMRRRGHGGVLFETYSHIGVSHANVFPGDYVTPLFSIYMKGEPQDPYKTPEYFVRCQEPHDRKRRPLELSGSTREASEPLRYSKNKRILWPTPGSSGYQKVSIYTFVCDS